MVTRAGRPRPSHGARPPGAAARLLWRGASALFVVAAVAALVLQVAALDAAGAAGAAEWAGQCELDVLLAVNAHHEGRHVDHLLAHAASRRREIQEGGSAWLCGEMTRCEAH